MASSVALLPIIGIILALVLLISGLIRLRLWGRRYLQEMQEIRVETGKLAKEVGQLRRELAQYSQD